jgi:MFS family permease
LHNSKSSTRIGTTFLTIWIGQLISGIGSGLTTFALGLFIFNSSHSAMQFGLIVVFGSVPGILLSPLAGVLVDRWNRGTAMAISQVGCAGSVLSMAVLLFMNQLTLRDICIAIGVNSIFQTLQWTSFSAATTVLVPKEGLVRAGGLVQLAQTASLIVSPLIAGTLIMLIPISAMLVLDIISYVFAFLTIVLVTVPTPPRTILKVKNNGITDEIRQGWGYIKDRPGLLYFLIFFTVENFGFAIIYVLLMPMILSFSSPLVLSRILSAFGLGLLLSGILMSVWRGPTYRVRFILGVAFLQGLGLGACGVQQSVWLIGIGLCIVGFGLPIVNSCTQAVWQTKAAPDIQGRVFAVRRMLVQATTPIAYILAGPLADRVFGPLLVPGGAWAHSVGRFIGVGAGRGIAFLFIVAGAIVMVAAVGAWMVTPLRELESEVPDALVETHEAAREMLIAVTEGAT